MDARNHGESAHSPHMSYELMCEDTVNLLREVGVSRTVLVGHSMGGKTAMLTALRHPAMVEHLVVLDVTPSTATSTSDLQEHVAVMKTLDLNTLSSRREADGRLNQLVPVSPTPHIPIYMYHVCFVSCSSGDT